ncbi:hypothetical protein GGI20_005565, partial [Coemansia sp. BCRC 34301]
MPINITDITLSKNSQVILDEEPYCNALDLVAECFRTENLLQDWNAVRKELANGSEMWALFKYGLIDSHYSPDLNLRETLYTKILNLNYAIDYCLLHKAGENDEIIKLTLIKQAIQRGLAKANETTAAAAHFAHQTLKGTPLAEMPLLIDQSTEIMQSDLIHSDTSTHWFAQMSTNPAGNLYVPKTSSDAKKIIAIGHMLEVVWVVIHSTQEMSDF